MIKVFLVDDHEVVRRGLSDLVGAQRDMEVVGEAGTARNALGRIEATAPNVAVLDVRLPDGSGIDLCRDIRSQMPAVACLMLTAYDDDAAMNASVLAGAAGYVLKDINGSRLVGAVRAAAEGRSVVSPALANRATESLRQRADDDDPRMGRLVFASGRFSGSSLME